MQVHSSRVPLWPCSCQVPAFGQAVQPQGGQVTRGGSRWICRPLQGFWVTFSSSTNKNPAAGSEHCERQRKLHPLVLHQAGMLQGIRPAALQRVRQPGLAELISLCIAPRAERPEAKKLLKHPYFSSIREVRHQGLCWVCSGAACDMPSSCLLLPG